ncbi:MAG: SRPBCC family protein [Gemmatimonadota bacterium]
MQQIHSSIDIDAPDHLVWAILTDFGSYEQWNPYIRAVLGKPSAGNMMQIALRGQRRAIASMGSLLTRAREPCELRWRKRTFAPGLYTTEHRIRIEALPSGGVRFHQIELIKGLFASFLGRGGQRATEEGFHAMNHALKARAEGMYEGLVAAGKPALSS